MGSQQASAAPPPPPFSPAPSTPRQVPSSSLKGHRSCGLQSCGLQSGSTRPCSSPGTCYRPGACRGKACGVPRDHGPHRASVILPHIYLPQPDPIVVAPPPPASSVTPSPPPPSLRPPWGSYVGRLYRGVMRKQATTALRRCLDKSLCHTAFLDL